jgi:hypothetical protein
MGGNNIAYVPIGDAVQEFSIQQNTYDAQYGHTGGGIFNTILKSGGSQFHGTGWEFLRRTSLDANTFQNTQSARPRFGTISISTAAEFPVRLHSEGAAQKTAL